MTLFRTVGIWLFCKRELSFLFYKTSGFIISIYNLTLRFAITAFLMMRRGVRQIPYQMACYLV